jgi:hypothetical protein
VGLHILGVWSWEEAGRTLTGACDFGTDFAHTGVGLLAQRTECLLAAFL